MFRQCRRVCLPQLYRGEGGVCLIESEWCTDNQTFGQVVLEALASGLVSPELSSTPC